MGDNRRAAPYSAAVNRYDPEVTIRPVDVQTNREEWPLDDDYPNIFTFEEILGHPTAETGTDETTGPDDPEKIA